MDVGIIGCGNISKTYLNCHKLFNNFKVIACADINHETALNSEKEFIELEKYAKYGDN